MVFPAVQMFLFLLTIVENHMFKRMVLNVVIRPEKSETPKSHVRPKTREIASETNFENKGNSPVIPGIRGILASKTAVVGISENMSQIVERVNAVLASLAGFRTVIGRAGPKLLLVGVTLHEVNQH